MNVNKKSYEIVDVKDLNALFQFLWHCPGFTIFCQTTAITLQATILTYLTKHSFLLPFTNIKLDFIE